MGNAMMVLLARVAGILFTLLGTRLLDQHSLGNILIGMGILMLVSTFASFGFPGSVPYFVTVRLLKDDERALSSLFHAAMLIIIPVSIIFAFLISCYADFIATQFYNEPSITPILPWMAWGIPFLALSMIFTAALRGMNRTVLAAFIDSVLWRVLPLVLLILIAVFGINNDKLIAQSVAMTPVLMAVTGFFYTFPLLSNISFFRLPEADRDLFDYTVNSWITSLATLLRTRGDMMLLGFFLSSSDVAVFSVGATLAMILQITNNIVSPAYRPIATRLIAEGKRGDLVSYHKKIVRLNLTIVVPISVFLLFFAEPFVITLFGAGYAASAVVLQIALLGIIPRAFMGPVNPTLLALGFANVVRRIDVATTFIFILTLVILTPLAGLSGAAIAFGVTGLIQNVWKNIEVRKHIYIPWVPSPSTIPFISLLFIFGLAAKYISISLLNATYGWLIVLPVFCLLSLTSAYSVKQITRNEIVQIINLFGKRFQGTAKVK